MLDFERTPEIAPKLIRAKELNLDVLLELLVRSRPYLVGLLLFDALSAHLHTLQHKEASHESNCS